VRNSDDDFYGNTPTVTGPLFDDPPLGITLPDDLRQVYQLISTRSAGNPVSIAQIQAQTGHSERTVKGIVEQLVVEYRIKIGARRETPSGYFMITSAADLAAAVGPYKAQILAMWKRLRVLEERHALLELLGQLQLLED